MNRESAEKLKIVSWVLFVIGLFIYPIFFWAIGAVTGYQAMRYGSNKNAFITNLVGIAVYVVIYILLFIFIMLMY